MADMVFWSDEKRQCSKVMVSMVFWSDPFAECCWHLSAKVVFFVFILVSRFDGLSLRRRKDSRLSCMSYETHLFGCSEKSLLEIDSIRESNRPVLAPLEEAARDTPKNARTLDGMLKPIQSRILQRRRGSVWDYEPEVPAQNAGPCPTSVQECWT